MEGICGLCFQQGELYQVPGYNIPTCIKCSEQISLGKGIVATATRSAIGHNPVPAHVPSTDPIGLTTVLSITQPPSGTEENAGDDTSGKSSKAMFKLNMDIEQTLQHIDNVFLFNDESCPICKKTFGRKSSLLNHIRNHSAERKFVCPYCQKGFTQAANLRNHERIHTNSRPFVCIDCGKAFTQITNLNNHRRLHTGERPFVCIESDCGRSFAQVTNLNNHMKTHHKVQQFVCNQCPSRFTQVSQLNMHLTTHGGLQGLVCPQCPDKTFKQQGHLQQHLKAHGIEYPYACGQCDEKFIQFAHLEHHSKMHEEFRFKCTMCSSSFNQEVLLKKHIQRHIDGRYLTCPVSGCHEGFTIKHHLTRHMQTHHSLNNYTKRISVKRSAAASGKYNCYFESCDEAFGDAETLNNHLRHVHGLSIVKNAGKRSKMDLLLEQLKQQHQKRN